MRLVQIEHMIGRRLDEMLARRQIERVQVVAQLRHIGHAHDVAAVVEYVQRQRGHDRVAHIALLLEEVVALAGAAAVLVPAAPLVDVHHDAALGIELVHSRAVVVHDVLHIVCLMQQLIPLVVGEFLRRAGCAAVVVHAERAGPYALLRHCAHHLARPGNVVPVRAAGHSDLLAGQAGADRIKAHILTRAHLGAHVAAAAPVLVADAPVAHAKGRFMAVCGALVGQRGFMRGRVAVFHPVADVQRGQRGHVGRDVGLCAHLIAEIHKLVRAHLIALHAPVPVVPPVDAPRPLLARANAVAPVVCLGKAAARPAHDAGIDLLKAVHKRLAPSAHIFDRAVLAHPQPVVKHAADMLGKVAVYVRADRAAGLGEEYRDVVLHAKKPPCAFYFPSLF